MKVQKLPASVRSKLQSGLTITDATQCVLELVENSLDANATAIAIRLHLSKFKIEVLDNGNGISKEDLELIGKRFMTSKCHEESDLDKVIVTYGFRGQALASLVDVCGNLTIKTKTEESKNSLFKVFKNGKASAVTVSSQGNSSKGTVVTVHDFMSTMPVRRRRISEIFDVAEIKNQLEYLAIIHNRVCFTLRDESKNALLLETRRKSGVVLMMADVLGLATNKFLVPINHKLKMYHVKGFVSVRRHSENNLQLFYVNNRIVFKSVVHKIVNDTIDKYFEDRVGFPYQGHGLNLNFSNPEFNVYLVQLHCPYGSFEIFRNLRKNTVEFRSWNEVLDCVQIGIKTALKIRDKKAREGELMESVENVEMKKDFFNLKNGVRGPVVKRKRGEMEERISGGSIRGEESPKEDGIHRPYKSVKESPVTVGQSVEMIRKWDTLRDEYSDSFLEFALWFRSRLKRDFKVFQLYNEFIQHKLKSKQGSAMLGNLAMNLRDSTISEDRSISEMEGMSSSVTKSGRSRSYESVRLNWLSQSGNRKKKSKSCHDKEVQMDEPVVKMDVMVQTSDQSFAVDCQAKSSQTPQKAPLKVDNEITPSTAFDCDNTVIVDSGRVRKSFDSFIYADRYSFMPKGLSQIEKTPEKTIKDGSEDVIPDTFKGFAFGTSAELVPGEIISELDRKAEENLIFYEYEVAKSKIESKFDVNSTRIDKETLASFKVIGQWDRKFIVVVLDSKITKMLAVLDQHAVDERIRLEALMKDCRGPEGDFVSVECDPPLACRAIEGVVPRLERVVSRYGVEWSVLDTGSVLLKRIPFCLTFGEDNPMKEGRIVKLAEDLLSDLVRESEETRGIFPDVPRVLHQAIATKACKTAIKFNDQLSLEDMKGLLNRLLECRLPFQCAHGRPSIAPILDLTDVNPKETNQNLNLKKFARNLKTTD